MTASGDAKTLMLDLSGEHGTLPAAEVLAVLEAEGVGHRVAGTDERVLLIAVEVADAKAIALRLAARLSMCHSISLHIASSGPSMDDIISAAAKAAETLPSYPATSTFRVRCERMKGHGEGLDTPGLEKEVARVLWKGRKVDLKAPGTDYRLLVSTRWHLGELLVRPDRAALEKKRARFRPYFSPVTLHPRLARSLVNLARLPPGGTILDPFCGTGGILLEAGTMGIGAHMVGTDVDPKMVEGCMANLEHYGVTGARVMEADVRDGARLLEGMTIDAIATDPPYARSSGTFGDDTWDLYSALFETAAHLLGPRRYISASLPCAELGDIPTKGLVPVETHAMKVHRSLTRYFHVLRKDG